MDMSVSLCGIGLSNPVIPASGTFGYGYEFAQLYDINCLGTFSFKGTTREPRFGNPTPRIAESAAGMVNAVGLQNPGVDKVISEELPQLKKVFHKPVMANVSGFSVEDYAYTCERLDKELAGGQYQLPQRPRRRHELRHGPGRRGGGGPGGEGGDPKAGHHEAYAQRDGYHGCRESL